MENPSQAPHRSESCSCTLGTSLNVGYLVDARLERSSWAKLGRLVLFPITLARLLVQNRCSVLGPLSLLLGRCQGGTSKGNKTEKTCNNNMHANRLSVAGEKSQSVVRADLGRTTRERLQ